MSSKSFVSSIPNVQAALDVYFESVRAYSPDGHEPILVWAWENAPQELRDFSRHGGDEDWVGVVPPNSWGVPLWMDTGTAFGCCDVQKQELPGGYIVCIGAHA